MFIESFRCSGHWEYKDEHKQARLHPWAVGHPSDEYKIATAKRCVHGDFRAHFISSGRAKETSGEVVPETEAEVAAAAAIQGGGRSRNPPAEETTRSEFSDGEEKAVLGKRKGGWWGRAQKPRVRNPEEEEAGSSSRS